MSDASRSNHESTTRQGENSPTMSSSENSAPEIDGDSAAASPRIDDIFGDYSEQTGAFFG